MLALTKLSRRMLAGVIACSFLESVKPIITRVWVILFLLHNFRILVSGGVVDSVSDPVTLLSPIFIGISGFVILIPLIVLGNEVLRRYVLRGLHGELEWKHSLLLQIFNFLWTHLICISILLYLLAEVGFYVIGLYIFVVTACFLFASLTVRYRGGASNLVTNVVFQNIGFGVYLLIASAYVVLVESFHLTLVQIFVIIMLPRLMLSSFANIMPIYHKNNGLKAIKKRLLKL
ncbi:MAG: hypothetical protein ACI9N9_001363 [Enterobacterales bacterium]|jgi:hypothetical protein